jgi:hypothetical protein
VNRERFDYVARVMLDGKAVRSVHRYTEESALRDIEPQPGEIVELWRLRMVKHSVGGWWSERDRTRVKGGAA